MSKEEWGTKRLCPTTGKRFYDLNKSPVVSPYTGEVVDIEVPRRKGAAPAAPRVVRAKVEEAVIEDAETDADEDVVETEDGEDSEIEDDLLEDDDDDNVSLDDLTDVASEDDEG